MSTQNEIVIRGAREHNLRNISLKLPKNKLICMTGVSGSGKSSLAFDTLYAEGQRRYVESLSSYARQFLGQMPKPAVDRVSGLSPSISIQQKASGRNPRSTVGTITEIYDYLRVLFARVGTGHCVNCSQPITAQTAEQIVESILQIPAGTKFQILAPIVQQKKGEFRDLFEDLLKQGFLRARVDGEVVQLTEDRQLDRQMRHTIEVIVDRLTAGQLQRGRLNESVETALRISNGLLLVWKSEGAARPDDEKSRQPKKRRTKKNSESDAEQLYSSDYACSACGISYASPSPRLFSFNSPQGMCLNCNGLGMRHDFIEEMLIPNDKQTIARGAVTLLGSTRKMGRWKRHLLLGAASAIEEEVGMKTDSLLKTPWKDLPDEARQKFLHGLGDKNVTYTWRHSGGIWKHGGTYDGVVSDLMDQYRKTNNPMRRRQLEKYMEFIPCTECGGSRLNAQARSVRIATASKAFRKHSSHVSLNLSEVCGLSILEAAEFFQQLDLDETCQFIATEVLKEIRGRLGFLLQCGLDYLALDRTAPTLSGGETQRIRLASQIGCGLVGVTYILDEPSIGLHPRDNKLLLDSLRDLRDQGNTVIVVEHDEETMRAADHIVDFGPGPGVRGGKVIAQGSIQQLKANAKSLTGQFLTGKQTIAIPDKRRKPGQHKLKITGASHNNLQGVDVEFPLETFICVTGVSGSGKSSLVNDILWQLLNRDLNKGKGNPGGFQRISGLQHLDKAIDIDQSPIGRTPRSNPATYVKLFDEIRTLFTKLPESRLRAYKPGRFSFNVADGRCAACEGYGANKLEMDFLADIWVTCPLCNGQRFNHETLEVRYKGASIADILDMDIQQALKHFESHPKISQLLQTLHDVGLDYLKLGQASPTLSGGEAQRIKLARELGKRSTGRTIYLLDEPTTGLHFADIQKLLEVLHGFVDAGNTVLVIEHNTDVIKTADWVIDLGPEGGAGGGTVVAQGTPEVIANCKQSQTGHALRESLKLKSTGSNGKASRNGAAYKLTRRISSVLDLQASQSQRNGETARSRNNIVIEGAEQHNLQKVAIELPREKMSVFCGPSGSGKSSLAMDTLYAEGQRRYVESLSAYARQFLGQMPKPRVDHIHGLPPAIAIEQKTTGHTPRSTVGTVTEIYDYLRVLYARLGVPYCPDCQVPIRTQTVDQVIDQLLSESAGEKILLLAPQEIAVGQNYDTLWKRLQSQGFLRVRIDGQTCRIEDVPEIDRRRKHDVEIIVDRLTLNPRSRSRIADSVESAFDLGKGMIRVAWCSSEPEEKWKTERRSLHYACPACESSFEPLSPHNFSFNSSLGWCEDCEGLGVEQGTNLSALIADPQRTLADDAIEAWPSVRNSPTFKRMLEAMADELGFPLDVPFSQLESTHQRIVLYGAGDRWVTHKKLGFRFQYKGLYPAIEEASRLSFSHRQRLHEMIGEVPCSSCNGSRLREDAAAVRLFGKTLLQLSTLPLVDALTFLNTVRLSASERKVVGELLKEATSRISFLVEVGLDYLSLNRPLPTLSGGETQRIRLAGQIGRALTGVLYVLDEPTIGLHPRDNHRLIQALNKLRKLGNTLVLVEHDREVIKQADRLYDFGPGAGRLGGTIVGDGTPNRLMKQANSLTGQYLADKQSIAVPIKRRMDSLYDHLTSPQITKLSTPRRLDPDALPVSPAEAWIELFGARENNLQNVDLRIPLGTLTCITGVSGSGKSSLIEETLSKALSKLLHRATDNPAPYDGLRGVEQINKIISVDQRPLGNTPASNPATYTGVFEQIRELFCRLPEAKVRGYRPARFSFNRAGGRCEECEGNGQKCIEMHFLPDVWVECDACHGKRYNAETLTVRYRGHSIADVLEMSIGDARKLFQNIPKIRSYLATLCEIGLDYLTLGQSAPTLSGGEAQRVKLAAELARPSTGKTLYILDEPTTGLHFDDIAKLLKVLNSLVEQGNTVVVIEHNLDVIKTADWIVDIGPEAGSGGGYIVAEGTPDDIVTHSGIHSRVSSKTKKARAKTNGNTSSGDFFPSHTGTVLAPVLKGADRRERDVYDAKAARRKHKDDIDLREIGRNAKMPWQTDGPGWHTNSRIGHNGQPCRWQGSALEQIIAPLEEDNRFAAVNWNHRSIVEVTNAEKQGGWFLHAMTGNEWLLTLRFRVKKGTFSQDELRSQLDLKPLDDIDDLPVYGRSSRVRVKNLKGPWQEVSIAVHWLRELQTPEFTAFYERAREAYLERIETQPIDKESLMPWKVLGRKWHLSRKGFPSGKRVSWTANALDQLLTTIENTLTNVESDWGNKQVVNLQTGSDNKQLAGTIHTKRRGGIDLTLFTSPGQIPLGRIAEFGSEREVGLNRDGREAVKIRFNTLKEVKNAKLKKLLADFNKKL